jgi:hypothetical protein
MPADPSPILPNPLVTTTAERAALRCETCGMPWAEHTAACARHAYRPQVAINETPEEARAVPNAYTGVFAEWTVIFPGKMGLSWKQAWHSGTKEAAEAQAAKNCNAIAVPVQLFEKMKEHERRMVIAERELALLRSAVKLPRESR